MGFHLHRFDCRVLEPHTCYMRADGKGRWAGTGLEQQPATPSSDLPPLDFWRPGLSEQKCEKRDCDCKLDVTVPEELPQGLENKCVMSVAMA